MKPQGDHIYDYTFKILLIGKDINIWMIIYLSNDMDGNISILIVSFSLRLIIKQLFHSK